MSEIKAFATADVLSTITGHLVSKIDGVYEVLNWMTGESVFTHQLPRICREATPVVLDLHPELSQAIAEAEQVNPTNWREWIAKWEDRYGAEITVPKFGADDHERIDPLSELAERIPPNKIVVVKCE